MKNYITSKDASLKLGTTEQHVRILCRDNKFNAEKIGNTWLIEKESFNKYKNKNIVEDKGNILSNKTSKPKLLSFFSGAMGLDLGLEKAGFETILACEVDKYCRQTIKKNKPNIALIGDIGDNKYTKDVIRKKAGLLEGEDID